MTISKHCVPFGFFMLYLFQSLGFAATACVEDMTRKKFMSVDAKRQDCFSKSNMTQASDNDSCQRLHAGEKDKFDECTRRATIRYKDHLRSCTTYTTKCLKLVIGERRKKCDPHELIAHGQNVEQCRNHLPPQDNGNNTPSNRHPNQDDGADAMIVPETVTTRQECTTFNEGRKGPNGQDEFFWNADKCVRNPTTIIKQDECESYGYIAYKTETKPEDYTLETGACAFN